MYPRIDFLYLSEPDMIEAGVLNAAECVRVCEETFSLLGEGDYLMGGANHNSHGLNIMFPKQTRFPNMPVAGPDRRFAAMRAISVDASMSAVTNGTAPTMRMPARDCRARF